jgi:hypothetical protein
MRWAAAGVAALIALPLLVVVIVLGSVSSQGGTATPPAGAVPAATALPGGENQWIGEVLVAIGAPGTSADIRSMGAWIGHESAWNASPPDGAGFTRNPLNMTQAPGAIGAINSVGVSVIPDWGTSVRDTAGRLTGGNYEDVVQLLRSGVGLCGSTLQGLSTWSGGGYSSVC